MNVTGHWFLLLIRCQRPGVIFSAFSVLFLFPSNDCSSETFHLVNHLLQSNVHLILLLFCIYSFVCSFVWSAFKCRYCSDLLCACGWMFILVCITKIWLYIIISWHIFIHRHPGLSAAFDMEWDGAWRRVLLTWLQVSFQSVFQLYKTGSSKLYYRKYAQLPHYVALV